MYGKCVTSPRRSVTTYFKSRLRNRLSIVLLVICLILSVISLYQNSLIEKLKFRQVGQKTRKNVNIDLTPRLEEPTSTPILRALLVFYPYNRKDSFLPELLWFYRSWIEMIKHEPKLWRTDILIYTKARDPELMYLGCVQNKIRIDQHERPTCRVFPYTKVSDRDLNRVNLTDKQTFQDLDLKRARLIAHHLRNYEYIDSINVVFEYYRSYSMYDYVLRTDLDTFLTKNFGTRVPANGTFLVGAGGYSTPFNNARLKRIAKNMEWDHADISNIGSTWYGPPNFTHRAANLTLYAMAYLSWSEFTTPEREKKLGVMLWPEWHYGVLLLYGSHLAINHLVVSEDFPLRLANKLLDQGVVSRDQKDLETVPRLHLHCWHSGDPFSKFVFKANGYKNLSANSYQNDSSPMGYAMRMSLESRDLKAIGLGRLFSEIVQTKKRNS